jgi:hypothetical protein
MEESDRSERQAGEPGRPALAGAGSQQEADVDARGLDKRRRVKGGTYGPTNQRVIMRFVIFFAALIVVLIGLKLAVDQLDKAPADNPVQAPWAQPGAPQPKPAQPLSADSPGADPRSQDPVH